MNAQQPKGKLDLGLCKQTASGITLPATRGGRCNRPHFSKSLRCRRSSFGMPSIRMPVNHCASIRAMPSIRDRDQGQFSKRAEAHILGMNSLPLHSTLLDQRCSQKPSILHRSRTQKTKEPPCTSLQFSIASEYLSYLNDAVSVRLAYLKFHRNSPSPIRPKMPTEAYNSPSLANISRMLIML